MSFYQASGYASLDASASRQVQPVQPETPRRKKGSVSGRKVKALSKPAEKKEKLDLSSMSLRDVYGSKVLKQIEEASVGKLTTRCGSSVTLEDLRGKGKFLCKTGINQYTHVFVTDVLEEDLPYSEIFYLNGPSARNLQVAMNPNRFYFHIESSSDTESSISPESEISPKAESFPETIDLPLGKIMPKPGSKVDSLLENHKYLYKTESGAFKCVKVVKVLIDSVYYIDKCLDSDEERVLISFRTDNFYHLPSPTAS